MRSSTRSALPTVLAILCCAASLFAQSTAKPATKGGSVSGRVTIKDKPAAGVLVALRKSEGGSPPWEAAARAITEQDGTYRIANVPPGSYNVSTTTPAYVAADKAGRKSVVIAEDENVEGVNFSLIRGGVITGKVTDAEGRPVIQHNVELFMADAFEPRPQTPQQQRQIYPTRTVQTDDRGIYRAFGLTPGRYKVAAGKGENSPMTSFSISPITYSQVFHPDAKDPAKATVVEVSEGSEATNVDIALGPTMQMFTVTGRVINSETGAPVPQIRFGLHRLVSDHVEYMNLNAASNARGEFTIEGLTPGKYGVFLFTDPANELRAEKITFDVLDQDVTGVTIKLARGATVIGQIILESDDKAVQKKLLEMKLHGYVNTYPGMATSASSPIAGDGSFRIAGLPGGMANFTIFPSGGYVPAGFVIARIERDGVTSQGLEVKDGETITGVKMFVRYGSATLRGVVTFENGTLPPGTRVMIRLTKPGDTMQYNRQAEVDARGQFFMENIPAGIYEVRATIYGGGNARTLEQKKDVNLTDGAVTNVTIAIDVSSIPNK